MTQVGDSTVGVDLLCEDPRWGSEVRLGGIAARAAAAVAARQPIPAGAEVCLVLTDDIRMRELNRGWRGQDKPTNVLSFPAGGHAGDTLGDIALGYETVAAEAERDGKPFEAHVTHLLVHGFLHLMGHDHETPDKADRMERLETEILGTLGIDDPYALGVFEPAETSP